MVLYSLISEYFPSIATAIGIILVADILFLTILLFMEREDPRSYMMWILVIIFLPFIGFFLYLMIGQTFYSRRVFGLKGMTDEAIFAVHELENHHIDEWEIQFPEDNDANFARYLLKSGGGGFTINNDAKFYTNGNEKFSDLFEDIKNAKHHVFMEYYIIRNDELGNKLMDLLIEKVKEGVEVKLLTDAFGTGKGPKKGILNFKKAGGEFALFHSVATLLLSPKKNNRNHRKIAVIDGDIAYIGGFNVGDEYLGKGKMGNWRDSALRVYGHAAIPATLRFIADWNYACKKNESIENIENYFIKTSKDYGIDPIQIVSGGPDIPGNNPIKFQYEGLINHAKEYVYIHTPYLVPEDGISDSLKCAAMRGVDVRIIIPDKPDHPLIYWNNMSSANNLMKYGVKVYLYNNGFVHSKTVVVDGTMGSVGSSNIDDRSMKLNFETNYQIYSDELCEEMKSAFLKDLEVCTQYSCEEYDKRSRMDKIKGVVSSFFRGFA